MTTPVYDELIRARGGRAPGALTDEVLKELAEHRASLELPPPVEIPVEEPEPVPEPEPEPVAVKPLQEKDPEPEPAPAEAVTEVIAIVDPDATRELPVQDKLAS